MIDGDHILQLIGVPIVLLAISATVHLFLQVICDNYIFPPKKWTVKAFLLMLFILSVPSIIIVWVLTKVSRGTGNRKLQGRQHANQH